MPRRDALPNVRLRHLQFLLALAEQRNLSRAASAMHMTQPAASRLLLELEQAFGQPLFERGRHGLRTLPAADAVLRFARMIRAEERLLSESMAQPAAAPPLRVGTLPTAPSVLVGALAAFKAQHPEVTVSLMQGALNALLPPLLDGELDLVVARFDPILLTERLAYERLADEGLSVVAATGHPLARRRQVSAQELSRWPWVSPPRHTSLYTHFAELFAGFPLPSDRIESTSPLTIHALLQDKRRLGLLSSSVPARLLLDIRVLPMRLRTAPGPMGVYTVRGRLPCDAAAEMAQALRGAAAAR